MSVASRQTPRRVTVGAVMAALGVLAVVVGLAGIVQPGKPAACSTAAAQIGGIYWVVAVPFILLAIVGIIVNASAVRSSRRATGQVSTLAVISVIACSALIPVTAYVGFVGGLSYGLCIPF